MLTIGTTIADRYEIVGKVGAGGMSDVYKARDKKLERFVAVKVLKSEYSEDRTFVSKFRAEAQSAAGLEHPNIVNIYDVGNENGTYYIIMEYVDGITLKTYIEKKEKLSFKEAVSIAIQVARGIEAAHNKEIIHRDIKPQNIIISTEGKVKVTDFGIARAASSNTISSDVMGSVHYASPEQARNGYVDGRSDIYSLGIVMYEMITGRVPFDGETAVAIAIQHLQEDLPKPSRFAPAIPISFERIIQKTTQKSPERRYQNIPELMKDLRRCLSEPDVDFVVIPPLFDSSKTRVMSDEEIKAIREASAAPEPVVKPMEKGKEAEDDAPELSPAVAALARKKSERENPQSIRTERSRTERSEKERRKRYKEEDYEADEEDDEEEKGGIISPGLSRLFTVLEVLILAIIVLVSIYLVGSAVKSFRMGKADNTEKTTEAGSETESELEENMVKMISLLGKNQMEAEADLADIGLKLEVGGYKASNQEPGSIVEQSVPVGEHVEEGTVILVTLSGKMESTQVAVPGVVGSTENAAENTLTAAGFKTQKTFEFSNSIEAGTVISQEPVSGAAAEEGSVVVLTISRGKKSVKTPQVEGKTESAAKKALEDRGLKVSCKSEYSSSVAEGYVISQSPAANKDVEAGTTVNLVISLGKEPVKEPEPSSDPSGTGSSTGGTSQDNGGSTSSENSGSDSGSNDTPATADPTAETAPDTTPAP